MDHLTLSWMKSPLILPINDPESKYHDHTIVEYNFGSAIELISPLLPLSYKDKDDPSLTYQIRAPSSVYSCSDATTFYPPWKPLLSKVGNPSMLWYEKNFLRLSSLIPDEVDEDEPALD